MRLRELQVPDALQDQLTASGVFTIADFAYAYNTTADLSSFVAKQPEELWQSLEVSDPEHCMPVARLRRALDRCKAITAQSDNSGSPSNASGPQQGIAANVWAEHAPPRLDDEAVQCLVTTFQSRYSGEYLDQDSCPVCGSSALPTNGQHCKAHYQADSVAVSHVRTAIPGTHGSSHSAHP